MKTLTTVIAAAFLAPAFSMAQAPAPTAKDPCAPIVQACKSAGFAPKQAKEGSGLWVDCIRPIVQGTSQPPKATIKLPTVDPSVVAACKAAHPKFGEKTR
jgi:hypothetical protein